MRWERIRRILYNVRQGGAEGNVIASRRTAGTGEDETPFVVAWPGGREIVFSTERGRLAAAICREKYQYATRGGRARVTCPLRVGDKSHLVRGGK